MTAYVIQFPCARCGGSCLPSPPDGELECILCARPYVASVKPRLRLVRDDADVTSVIERERRAIDRAQAAGKRAWSS